MQEVKVGRIYKTQNGYYRCDVIFDNNIKPIRKSFSSKKKYELVEKRDEWIEKYKDTYLDPFKPQSLGVLYYKWVMTVKKGTVGGNTISTYLTTYEKRLKNKPIGTMNILDITPLDAQEYVNVQLIEDSIKSVGKALTHIKSFFNYAIKSNLVKTDPFATITLTYKPEKRLAYTIEEQQVITRSINVEDNIDVLIYSSLVAGLRKGEVTALTIPDFVNNTFMINKQYGRETFYENGQRKFINTIKPLKTKASYRSVPIPDQAAEVINNHIQRIKRINLLTGYKYNPNNLLFPDENGGYIEPKRPTRRLQKICEDNNIEYKTFHALRHTYITRLAENNVSPKIAQALAGHEDFSTTMNIYTHVSDAEKEKAIQNLTDNKVFSII